MYQAKKENVPSQECECTKPGKGYIHDRSLSWLGTFTFLPWYTHFPGLVHSLSWLGTYNLLTSRVEQFWVVHLFAFVSNISMSQTEKQLVP
jgi:hypothetical protein